MRVPTRREMREVNEWLVGAASTLNYMKAQAGDLGLLKTMHALDEGTRALGYEVAEMRERFENSGRRPKRRGNR